MMKGVRALGRALAVSALCVILLAPNGLQAAGDSPWVEVPDTYRGIWSPDCGTGNVLFLITGFGWSILDASGSPAQVQTARFSGVKRADGGELVAEIPVQSKEHLTFKLAGDDTLRLPEGDRVARCRSVPDGIDPVNRVWIDGLRDLEALLRGCREGSEACRKTAMRLGDVNDDGRLSAAEIARAVRRVMAAGSVMEANFERRAPTDAETLRAALQHRVTASAEIGRNAVQALDVDGSGFLTRTELGLYPRAIMPDDLSAVPLEIPPEL